jgi:hypothetical protein
VKVANPFDAIVLRALDQARAAAAEQSHLGSSLPLLEPDDPEQWPAPSRA